MVANPVVDQVISAGLGESKPFVSSITSKIFIVKKVRTRGIYCSRKINVRCKMRAHLPFVCVKSPTIIFTFPFSICCETTGYFHCIFTWRVKMVAWNTPHTNCHFANYMHLQVTSQRIWLFPVFFCYGCHQGVVDDEAFLEFLFLELFSFRN